MNRFSSVQGRHFIFLSVLFVLGFVLSSCSSPGNRFRTRLLHKHPVNTLVLASTRNILREGETTDIRVMGMAGTHQFKLNDHVTFHVKNSQYGDLSGSDQFVASSPTPPDKGVEIYATYEQRISRDKTTANRVVRSNPIVIHVRPADEKPEYPSPGDWEAEKERKSDMINR